MRFQYVRLRYTDEIVDVTPPDGYQMHSWMFSGVDDGWIVICWRPLPVFANVGGCVQVPTFVCSPPESTHVEPFEPPPFHDGHGDDGRLLAGP